MGEVAQSGEDERGALGRSARLVAIILFGSSLLTAIVFWSSTATAATEDRWVLVETRINPNEAPTEFVSGVTPNYFGEPRFEGKFDRYTITATSISSHRRDVDYGVEAYNMTTTVTFDTPPVVLVPGEVVTLSASGSAGGANDGWNPGEQFEIRSDGVSFEGDTYFAFGLNPDYYQSSGSIAPSFTVPAPWSDDAEFAISAFYWNCASCLVEWVYRADTAPPTTTAPATSPTTTTPPASTTTQPDPLACIVFGRVTDAGARRFGPPDEDGHPLVGVSLKLLVEGMLELPTTAATDESGNYEIVVLEDDIPVGMQIDVDQVQVELELAEAAHDPSRFEVLPRNESALLLSDPFYLDDACRGNGLVEKDFPLGAIPEDYVATWPPKQYWDDLGEIYHRIHNGTRLADLLGQSLDYGNPMKVCAFCTGLFGTGSTAAFWRGRFTDGVVGKPEATIFFGNKATFLSDPGWPDNREYHEFGHQFLADAFANEMPRFTGNVNHGGYYRNLSSADSWTEGFAVFYSTMIAKHVDLEAMPEWYVKKYNLEDDFRPWFAAGKREGIALASLLLDLEDGPDDYAQGRTLPDLRIDWYDTYTDPALGTVLVGEVANRSRRYIDFSEQTMVAAEFRLDGSVVHTGWAITTPWDLPGAGRKGLFAVVVPPDVTWDRIDVVAFEGRPGDVATDDDPVDLTLQEVWNTIVQYTSGQPNSNGYLFDVADLYDAFSAAFGGRDVDDNGMDDIDQVFVAHGFFADRDGDRSFHTETPGMTGHPARGSFAELIPRRNLPPAPGTMMTVDAGGVAAHVVVQTIDADGAGYSFLVTPDDEGRVHVPVPGTDQGGTVMLGVVAAGYEPTIAGSIDIETFWADVEVRGEDAAPRFDVTLAPSDPSRSADVSIPALLLGAAGILLTLAAVFAVRGGRRRLKGNGDA